MVTWCERRNDAINIEDKKKEICPKEDNYQTPSPVIVPLPVMLMHLSDIDCGDGQRIRAIYQKFKAFYFILNQPNESTSQPNPSDNNNNIFL